MAQRGSAPFPGGATPLPNPLVDTLLPTLKDTELRLLLVVLRQTWGWKEGSETGGARTKRRDWISHTQLCRRTGRGSDAVSKAVDVLVSAGLIAVEDASGRPLASPEERRRFLGRLYFRPGDLWTSSHACRPGKAETTKTNENRTIRRDGWQRVVPPS